MSQRAGFISQFWFNIGPWNFQRVSAVNTVGKSNDFSKAHDHQKKSCKRFVWSE